MLTVCNYASTRTTIHLCACVCADVCVRVCSCVAVHATRRILLAAEKKVMDGLLTLDRNAPEEEPKKKSCC